MKLENYEVLRVSDTDLRFVAQTTFRPFLNLISVKNFIDTIDKAKKDNDYTERTYAELTERRVKTVVSYAPLSKEEEENLKEQAKDHYCKFDNKFRASIPFELKKKFKKKFSLSRWIEDLKVWEVGSRSEIKLVKFINDNIELFKAYKEARDLKDNKLKNSYSLDGNTYNCKEELKSNFNAFYHNKKWYVDANIYKEAQLFVDNFKKEEEE